LLKAALGYYHNYQISSIALFFLYEELVAWIFLRKEVQEQLRQEEVLVPAKEGWAKQIRKEATVSQGEGPQGQEVIIQLWLKEEKCQHLLGSNQFWGS
jgi:hypothetical protein